MIRRRGLVLLILLLSLALPQGSSSHASGTAPDAVIDDGRTVTSDGGRFGYGSEEVQPVIVPYSGDLHAGGSFDLTWTNISYVENAGAIGTTGTTTGLRMVNPYGAPVGNSRNLAEDLAHIGQGNVTFPAFLFNASGVWTLHDGNGATVGRVFVAPAYGAVVGLSSTTLTRGSATSLTVHVTDGYGDPVPDARVVLRRDPDASASADFAGSTWMNGTGAPGQGQNGDYVFALTPQRAGSYGAHATIGADEHTSYGVATFVVVENASTPITGTHSVHSGQIKFRGANAPVAGGTFDLTVTRIMGATSLTGYTLHDPTGAQVGAPRDLYLDGAHAGAFNVTFPAATLPMAGKWTLEGPNGFEAQFTVRAPHGKK